MRCDRTAYGFYVGEDWFPLHDRSDPHDLAFRRAFFDYVGPVTFRRHATLTAADHAGAS